VTPGKAKHSIVEYKLYVITSYWLKRILFIRRKCQRIISANKLIFIQQSREKNSGLQKLLNFS
jgi:hypothetical protein